MTIQVDIRSNTQSINIQVEIAHNPSLINQRFASSVNPDSPLRDALTSATYPTTATCNEIKGYVATVADCLSHLKMPSGLTGYFDKDLNSVVIQGKLDALPASTIKVDNLTDQLQQHLERCFCIDDNCASSIPSGLHGSTRVSQQLLNRLPQFINDKHGQSYRLSVFNILDHIPDCVKHLTSLYIDTFNQHGPKYDKTAIRNDSYFAQANDWVIFISDNENPHLVVGILKLREFPRAWPIQDLGPIHTQFTDELKNRYKGINGGLNLEYIEINRCGVGLASSIIKELQKLEYEFICLDELEGTPDKLYSNLGFQPSKANESKYSNKNFLAMTLTWVNPNYR